MSVVIYLSIYLSGVTGTQILLSAKIPFHSLWPQGLRRCTKRTGLPSSRVSVLNVPLLWILGWSMNMWILGLKRGLGQTNPSNIIKQYEFTGLVECS